MARGVTIDIAARISGYEQSLNQLRVAIQKLDPGSALAKSLNKGLATAESQVKSLGKNLNPKFTSDAQLDKFIDKFNGVGDVIDSIRMKMQDITSSDLNFDTANESIRGLVQQLNELQNELTGNINKGFKDAINNSEELTKAFSELDIDIKDKNPGEIFEALAKKAEESQVRVEAATKNLTKAQENLTRKQTTLSKAENSPINNKEVLQNELQELTASYTKAMETIKADVTASLTNMLGADNPQLDKIATAFLGGLTSDNLKDRLKELKDKLQTELGKGISAKEIYSKLFGDMGKGGNAQAVSTTIISKLFPNLIEIKEQFSQKLQEISTGLTTNQVKIINDLISKQDIEAALNETLKDVDTAYKKLQGELIQKRQEVVEALANVDTAKQQQKSVTTESTQITNLQADLLNRIKVLENENQTLKDKINEITQAIINQKESNTKEVKDLASKAAETASQWKITTDAANQYSEALEKVQQREQLVGKIEGVVQRWFSIYAAVRMVGNAIRSVISTIKELDKTITDITIVTNMSREDLWGQMPQYTQMAQDYAVSISGVYQVSQLFYQQGLQTNDVLTLTGETLKMARIAGLDYAEATNYMTNALRSFKLEMDEASRVTDVYSVLAANAAVSVSEIAEAMSKTASSAYAVGSSLENTATMITVMTEATRESASNIGSALKSIISRYGEMTSNPKQLIDSEGEEMSLNKVDRALQSVGITLQDTQGQFRNFDDVIMELASVWDTLDNNTQRYIATVMAGNRQQSRFLALVSSYERYAELSEKAANAAGAGEEQFEKTLQGIEARTQQLQTSLQNLYTGAGLEELYGWLLGIADNVLSYYNKIADAFGNGIAGATAAVVTFGAQFYNIANIVVNVLKLIKAHYTTSQKEITAIQDAEAMIRSKKETTEQQSMADRIVRIWKEAEAKKTNISMTEAAKRVKKEIEAENKAKGIKTRSLGSTLGNAAYGLGTVGSIIGSMVEGNTGNWISGAGGVVGAIGALASQNYIGAAMSLISAIPSLVSAIGGEVESTAEKVERLGKSIEEANTKQIQSKKALTTLADYKKKYDELRESQYKDEEHRKQWIELNNEIAASYPELIKGMNAEGNYIVDMTTGYQQLAAAKANAYKSDFLNLVQNELTGLQSIDYVLKHIYDIGPLGSGGLWKSNASLIGEIEEPDKIYDIYKENFATLKDIFVNPFGEQGIQLGPNVDIEKVLKPYNESWNNIIIAFKEQANAGESYANALINITKQFGDDTPIIQQDIYNYWLERKAAIQFQETLLNNQISTYADSWLQYLQTLTGITSNDLQLDLMSKEITDSWNNYYEKHKNDKNTEGKEKSYGDIFSDFLQEKYLPDWYNKLETETHYLQDETLEAIWENISHYKPSEFAKIDWGSKQAEIEGLYNEKLEDIYKSFSDQFQYLGTKNDVGITVFRGRTDKLVESYKEAFAPGYLSFIVDSYEKIIQLNKDNKQEAILGVNNLEDIFDVLKDIQDPELQNKILNIISSGDLFSLTGIYDILDQLSQIDWSNNQNEEKRLAGLIPLLLEHINVNVLTEYETLTSTMSSQLKDLSTALSNAEKGMSLEDAINMADKLEISLDKFDFRQGKYYYDNIKVLAQNYMKNYDAILAKIDEYYNDAIAKAENEQQIEALEKARKNAYEGVKKSNDYLIRSTYLSQNRISEFLAEFADEGLTIKESELKASLAAGKVPKELKDYATELIEWYNSLGDDVYKVFMDSLSSGEMASITVTDSNKDILSNEVFQDLIQGEVELGETIIVNFAKATNAQLQDVYEYFANNQEISNKERESYLSTIDSELKSRNTQNIYKEVFNSYESFDRTMAEKFAKAVGKDLSAMNLTFDEIDRTFSMSIEQMKQYAAKLRSEGASPEVIAELTDIIQDAYKNVGDLIIKGLEGTLSNAEGQQLIDAVKKNFGIDISLQQLNSGLGISRNLAIELYDKLNGVSSIAGKIVFDKLKDDLTASGEECETILGTLNKIKDITDKINNSSKDQIKTLETQKKLYEKIAETQAFNPKAYDFMNRSIPNGVQSPFTFLSNTIEAISSIGEMIETGYADPEKLYTLFRTYDELGGLVEGGLTLFGQKFTGAADDFTHAWENTMTAWEGVGGESKVVLSKLGDGIEFSLEDAASGMQKGLAAIADQQIEQLKAVRETFVAIQALEGLEDEKKALLGSDGVLSIEDMFGGSGKTEQFTKFIEELSKLTDEYKKELNELITVTQDGEQVGIIDFLTKTGLSKEQVEAAIPAIQQLLNLIGTDIDFDVNNPVESLRKLLAGSDPLTQSINLQAVLDVSGGTIDQAEQLMGIINEALTIDGSGNVTIKGQSANAAFTLDIKGNGAEADVTWADGKTDHFKAGQYRKLDLWLIQRAKDYAERSGLTFDSSNPLTITSISTNAVLKNDPNNSSVGISIEYASQPGEYGKVTIDNVVKTFGSTTTAEEALKAAAADYVKNSGEITDYEIATQSANVTNDTSNPNINVSIRYSDEGHISGDVIVGTIGRRFGPKEHYKTAGEALQAAAEEYDLTVGSGTLHNISLGGKIVNIVSANGVNYDFTFERDTQSTLADIGHEWGNVSSDLLTIIASAEGSGVNLGGGVKVDKFGTTWTVTVRDVDINGSNKINYKFSIKPNALINKEELKDQWDDVGTEIDELCNIFLQNPPKIPENSSIDIVKLANGNYSIKVRDMSLDGNATVSYSFTLTPQQLTDEASWQSHMESVRQAYEIYSSDLYALAKDLGIQNFDITETGLQSGILSVLMSLDGKTVVDCTYDIEWGENDADKASEKIGIFRTRINALKAEAEQFRQEYSSSDTKTEPNPAPIPIFPDSTEFDATQKIKITKEGYEVYSSNGGLLGTDATDILDGIKSKSDELKKQYASNSDLAVDNTPIDLFPNAILYNAVQKIQLTGQGYQIFDSKGQLIGEGTYSTAIAAINAALYAPKRELSVIDNKALTVSESEKDTELAAEKAIKRAGRQNAANTQNNSDVAQVNEEDEENIAEEQIAEYHQMQADIDKLNELLSNDTDLAKVINEYFNAVVDETVESGMDVFENAAELKQDVLDQLGIEISDEAADLLLRLIMQPLEEFSYDNYHLDDNEFKQVLNEKRISIIKSLIPDTAGEVYKTGTSGSSKVTLPKLGSMEDREGLTNTLADLNGTLELFSQAWQVKFGVNNTQIKGNKDPQQLLVITTQQMAEVINSTSSTTETISTNTNLIDTALDNINSTSQQILSKIPDNSKQFSLAELAATELKATVHGDFWGEGNQIVFSDGHGGNIHMNLKQYIEQFMQTLQEMQQIANDTNITVDINANNAPFISKLDEAIARANRSIATVKVTMKQFDDYNLPVETLAKGNVALGKGTLMGELGPELYVTKGHYYIAGRNGAEFVDLPDDAIVFNHLQTKRLLGTGSSGRGHAVTNEKKATSYAGGNVAMANASGVIGAIDAAIAAWTKIKELSLKDFATKAGAGGGGGGGKNGLDKGYIADLERWYNLLRQIEEAERDINYQEQLRSKLQSDQISNGKAIYNSQKKQIELLNDEIAYHTELATLQERYYKQRQEDFKNSEYSRIFKLTDSGLLQYRDEDLDKNSNLVGLFALAALNETDASGKAKYTAEEQYNMLVGMNFGKEMQYTTSGEAIDVGEEGGYEKAVETFWEKLNGWKEELDDLNDGYHEQLEAIVENETERNKLIQEVIDNQLEVENKVLEAIENREQAIIDELQDERNALAEAADKYINGLNRQLSKEREMYEQQESEENLRKLRRQLGILERSGGSSSQINSLRQQIASAEQDAYFDAQQKQIDAIKEASDLELERLDHQIEIMQETLAYQKENGLFWDEVTDIMSRSPEEIMNFITQYDPEWPSLSTLDQEQRLKTLGDSVEAWAAYYQDKITNGQDITHVDDWKNNLTTLSKISDTTLPEIVKEIGDLLDGNGDIQGIDSLIVKLQELKDKYGDIPGLQDLINDLTDIKTKGGKIAPEDLTKIENDFNKVLQGITGNSDLTFKALKEAFDNELKNTGSIYEALIKIAKLLGYDVSDTNNKVSENTGGATTSSGNTTNSSSNSTQYYSYINKKGEWKYATKEWALANSIDGKITPYNPSGSASSSDSINSSSQKFGYSVSGGGLSVTSAKKYDSGDAAVSAAADWIASQKPTDANRKAALNSIRVFKQGGLANYTGLAMLHGSKSRPEAVFTAEQTAILRDDILSDSPNSLLSLLQDFRNSIAGVSSTAALSAASSIVIENASVNMNIDSIANDYDAQRAGEQALNRMLEIARKTNVQSLRR